MQQEDLQLKSKHLRSSEAVVDIIEDEIEVAGINLASFVGDYGEEDEEEQSDGAYDELLSDD